MKTAMELVLARIEMLEGKKDDIHWEMFKNDCMEKEKKQMIEFGQYISRNGWVARTMEEFLKDYKKTQNYSQFYNETQQILNKNK